MMLSLEKDITIKKLYVLSKSSDCRLMPLLITVHCLAKNELNNSAVFVKSVTNLFSLNKSGIIGAFLLFKNIFRIDQYSLADTWEPLSLLDILVQYLSIESFIKLTILLWSSLNSSNAFVFLPLWIYFLKHIL